MKTIVPNIGKTLKVIAAAAAMAFAAASANADTGYSWTGAGATGAWNDAANWQDGLLPDAAGPISFVKDAAGFWNVLFTNQVETVAGPLCVNGVAGSGVVFDAEPTVTVVEPEEEGGESTTQTTYDNGLSLAGEAKDLWVGGTNQYGSAEFRRGVYAFGNLWLDGASSLALNGTDSITLAGNANFDRGTVTAENANLEGVNINVGNTPDAVASVVKNGGDWHFTGPLYIGSTSGHSITASMVQNSGTFMVDGYFCIGKDGDAANTTPDCSFTLNGGTVNAKKPVLVGDWGVPAGKYKVVVNGGEFNAGDYITLSGSDKNGGRADGEFYVSNGVVTVANSFLFSRGNSTADNKMLLALEGGTLKAKDIRYATDSDTAGCTRLGMATVLFDGGTFAAAAAGDILPAHGNLSVQVGANGATIDTDGNNVSISSAIATADGLATDGGLKLVGGGKVTMNGAASYTGATTIVLPTKIEVADAAAKDDVLSGGLVVDLSDAVLPVGRFAVLTITGGDTCTAADLAKCSSTDPSIVFELSADQKSICIVFPASAEAFVWTKNENGNFSEASNWLVNGEVSAIAPTNGAEIVFMTTADVEPVCDMDLTVSKLIWASGYAKASITNAADIGKLTVSTGNVINYSDYTQDLNVPVEYKNGSSYSNIDYKNRTVTYWGGVKGNLPSHNTLYGKYTLTATSWNLSSALTLKAGTTVLASGMTLDNRGKQLIAEAGSELNVNKLHKNQITHFHRAKIRKNVYHY